MALSNMLNEPRREITETIIGLVVVAGGLAVFLVPDYYFAVWLRTVTTDSTAGTPLLLGMFFGVPLAMVLGIGISGAAVFIHFVGEGLCNALERHGVRLRPIR